MKTHTIESGNMHIWTIENWKNNLSESDRRTGLSLKIDSTVDDDVRVACKNFAKWMRQEYYFPLRVPVYVRGTAYIRTMDKDRVAGSFFEPDSFDTEPYVRIAAGGYADLLASRGRDDAIASILFTLSHELTHYFQWINALQLTDVGRERPATEYARYILHEYSATRKHP